MPPPPAAITFVARGHSGNEWTIPLDLNGVTVRFTITQRPRTEVVSVQFAIVPEGGPWGSQAGGAVSGAIRTFAPVGENWAPGEHTATAAWDGRDDHGNPVALGRYRLVAVAITNADRDVQCGDGSGRGIEKFAGTRAGGGLGLFSVTCRQPGSGNPHDLATTE
jgi:hypothetical protein